MDWQTIRNQFMRDTSGDYPGSSLEQELIDAYAEHPTAVERSVEKITLGFKAGKIHSPWGALKAEVAKAILAANNPTHDQGSSREKAIQRAEQWIRTAGIHYDRASEIEHALFGTAELESTLTKAGQPIVTSGTTLLDAHTDDLHLRRRLVELWEHERPRGQRTEQEAEERGARYVEQRAELQAALRHARQLADAGIGNLQAPVLDDDIPF